MSEISETKTIEKYTYIRLDGTPGDFKLETEKLETSRKCDGFSFSPCPKSNNAIFTITRYYLCCECATQDNWVRPSLRLNPNK